MDIKEKQARWAVERPLFEAEFIHSHLLPFFRFNENTGDYEIKDECLNTDTSEDRRLAYETLNTGWVMWLRAKRTVKAVPEGFVLVRKELPESIAETLALDRVAKPVGNEIDPIWIEITENVYKEHLRSKKWELWRDYKAMIEAQEQDHA
ncbi:MULTISPECIES: hypothetical protein [Acinetobacter]|uniref:hypothetical protein n=1 Tax=Acinetobacter TaxID=469 RepID=UPI0004451E33|nr:MULTISPECIES: hypothetical protein [Acinetobacter]EXB32275.1 hypothetical protein J546_2303 [Acinetobacter sp. 1461402]